MLSLRNVVVGVVLRRQRRDRTCEGRMSGMLCGSQFVLAVAKEGVEAVPSALQEVSEWRGVVVLVLHKRMWS
jgi:hypothetical protein